MFSAALTSNKRILSKPKNLYIFIFFYLYAALLLLFCTPNSPLFSTQTWVDPNVYMDVGRAMNKGLVLYRDVFDHKGPLFLMIFALLAPISRHSLLGLYLLQTICLGTSLLFLFKTARLFVSHTASLIICAGFPFFLLSQTIYCNGGGSPEEIMLPVLMGSLYFIIESFVEPKEIVVPGLADSTHANPVQSDHTRADSVHLLRGRSGLRRFWFLGFFCGIVLLSKFNLSVFIAGGVGMLLLQFLMKKDIRSFGSALARFFCGILISFLPCIIYWTVTRSFKDCYDTYILFNINYVASKTLPDPLFSAARTLMIIFIKNFAAILFVVLGVIILQLKKALHSYAVLTLLLMFISLLCVTFKAGYAYWYYCIPFVCFAGLGEIGIAIFIREITVHSNAKSFFSRHPLFSRFIIALIISTLLVSILLFNGFWHLSRPFSPEKTGVETACNAILTSWEETKKPGTPNILLYDSAETGFYSTLGTVPVFRYFYAPGLDRSLMQDYVNEQNSYVTRGLPDFIICISGYDDADFGIVELNSDYYQLGVFERTIKEPNFDSGLAYILVYQKR